MKNTLLLAASIAACAFASTAAQAAVRFEFAGPSGTASFLLDESPKPDFSQTFLGSNQFGFKNVAGTFGGIAGVAQTISFGDGLFASLSISAPNLGFTQFISPVLFTGPATAPKFIPGSYTVINPFLGNGNLSITQVAAAVPEPASWMLMIIGFGALGGALRQRRRRVTFSFA